MTYPTSPLKREALRYDGEGRYAIAQTMPRPAMRWLARSALDGIVIGSVTLLAVFGLIGLVTS